MELPRSNTLIVSLPNRAAERTEAPPDENATLEITGHSDPFPCPVKTAQS